MKRKPLTQDEAFARWWAKSAPNPAFVESRKDRTMELIRDWSKGAFANGIAFGRRREQARNK